MAGQLSSHAATKTLTQPKINKCFLKNPLGVSTEAWKQRCYLRPTLPCLVVHTLPIASLVLRQESHVTYQYASAAVFLTLEEYFVDFTSLPKVGKRKTDEEGCINFLTADLLHSFMLLMRPLEHLIFTSLIQCICICESDQGSRTTMNDMK